MQKLGGVVILMQQSLIKNEEANVLNGIRYLVGNENVIKNMPYVSVKEPFEEPIIEFTNALSKELMSSPLARQYPDVLTLGFWLRKSSTLKFKERFVKYDGNLYLGRGIAFHIAPSNVAVNYAYSLMIGMLTGNANIVRIPSKEFPQVDIINEAINKVLEQMEYMKPYICLVKYDRNKEINDYFSKIADTRIIWGGDATIEEIRKSPLAPRAAEITFADRYSLAVIDSDVYLEVENKNKVAEDFYNDTFLSDQNACTSPRIIVWSGGQKMQAKQEFWNKLQSVAEEKYVFQPIQAVNKLTSSYLLSAYMDGVCVEDRRDNLIVRLKVPRLTDELMEFKDNSGYFMEYDCDDIQDLKELCNNTHCQTISYIGDKNMLRPLLQLGIKGVDRIVPIGKTMDFDFIWDGYNLFERLTRTVNIL